MSNVEIKEIHKEAASLFLFWPSGFVNDVGAFEHANTKDTARDQAAAIIEKLAQFIANWEEIGRNNATS
jgi:hypothetical protein